MTGGRFRHGQSGVTQATAELLAAIGHVARKRIRAQEEIRKREIGIVPWRGAEATIDGPLQQACRFLVAPPGIQTPAKLGQALRIVRIESDGRALRLFRLIEVARDVEQSRERLAARHIVRCYVDGLSGEIEAGLNLAPPAP